MDSMVAPIVILGYFALLLCIAHLTSRHAGEAAFFTGDRRSPWPLVAFGMVGATISGVTFVSVPGEVGTSQWHYLQFVLGNFCGYWIIAFVLVPIYYKMRLVSIYEYLSSRLGTVSRKTGAWSFIVSQTVGASFRLYLVVGVLQTIVFDAFGVPFTVTVAASIAMIWLYTFRAGIKTVVWTDTLQTVFIIAAVLTAVVAISQGLGASPSELCDIVSQSSLSTVFEFDWQSRHNFFKQFAAGVGIVIVMNGLDQNIMQKNLTCRNCAESQKNIMVFSVIFLLVNVLFLSLGVLLYRYAEVRQVALPALTDNLFPQLATQCFGTFAAMAFLLGITSAAYSSADSALTALTTVFCIDILDRRENMPPRRRRLIHIGFSAVMFCVVVLFGAINDSSVVSGIFTLAGYTYGPLLGLFLFGLTTSRVIGRHAWVPVVCLAAPVVCFFLSRYSAVILGGYQMGFELLLVNGALVYAGLWLLSAPSRSR